MLNKVRGRASGQSGLEAKEKKSEIFSSPGGCRDRGRHILGRATLHRDRGLSNLGLLGSAQLACCCCFFINKAPGGENGGAAGEPCSFVPGTWPDGTF